LVRRASAEFLLSGFLGSGKTTLVDRVLKALPFALTAVRIRGTGEIVFLQAVARIAAFDLGAAPTRGPSSVRVRIQRIPS
jgi:hypothetical protein